MSIKGVSAGLCVPDCDICPAVDRDVHTFLKGTADEYVEAVSQYRNDSAVLANARTLKICIDHSLTKEDKAHVLSFLVGPPMCVLLLTPVRGPLRAVGVGVAHSHPLVALT